MFECAHASPALDASRDIVPGQGPLAGETEAHVWDIFLLTRTDRQSDRVEVSPEQLVEANEAAEVTPRPLQEGAGRARADWAGRRERIGAGPADRDQDQRHRVVPLASQDHRAAVARRSVVGCRQSNESTRAHDSPRGWWLCADTQTCARRRRTR